MSIEIVDPYNLQTLPSQLLLMGYQFRFDSEIPTTMDLAQKHILDGKELPAVFLTDHQTKGQGRGEGRVWMDVSGKAILMSVGLHITEQSTPYFPDLVALHTASALRVSTGIESLKIKYPNDLVVDNKKVGGILIRNVYDGDRYLGTNVGIGINVHYTPDELEGYATEYPASSLGLHSVESLRREALVLAIVKGLRFVSTDSHVFMTNPHEEGVQNERWQKLSSVVGKEVQIESGSEVVVKGEVIDTKIGKGIKVGANWYDRFDEKMKVRVIN